MVAQRNMFAMLADEQDKQDETSDNNSQPTDDDDAASDAQPVSDAPSIEVHQSDDADSAVSQQDSGGSKLSPKAKKLRADTTRRKQMMAFLMNFHDFAHGPEQPLEDGIWGAVMHPSTKVDLPGGENPVEDGTKVRCRITPVPGSTASYENPNNVWLTPALPAKLGFPVKITRWPFPQGAEEERNKYNYFAHSLFVGENPSKSSFAKSTHEGLMGDFLIVRTDGTDLSDQQVEVLVHYINDEFSEDAVQLLDMDEGREKNKCKRQLADKYLNPEAFHAYAKEYRRERVVNGGFWDAAVSPVTVTLGDVKPACGRCFKRDVGKGEFLVCEGCEDRFYCSKACKDRDEKRHAAICFSEDEIVESDSGGSEESQSSDFSRSQAASE